MANKLTLIYECQECGDRFDYEMREKMIDDDTDYHTGNKIKEKDKHQKGASPILDIQFKPVIHNCGVDPQIDGIAVAVAIRKLPNASLSKT